MKITDKLSLRAMALQLAIESDSVSMSMMADNIIQRAKTFEMYIQDGVELPNFMPLPDCNMSVNVCNGCVEEYDDEDDDGIGIN